MASLSENLAAQQVARQANSAKRKKVMDAVLKIAQESASTGATLLPPSPVAANVAPASGIVGTPASGPLAPGKGGFNPQFNSELQRLLKDFGGKVTINSGYRSPERQAQLFANAVKKYGSEAAARKWVAPPGHSKHNEGLAADLHFADAATRAAVHAKAAQYGLVFPMAYENWHIEPIGARKK